MNSLRSLFALIIGVSSVFAESQPAASPTRHVPQLVQKLSPVGRPSPTERLKLSLMLPLERTNELNQLLGDLYNPASARFRQYLSPDEFSARFSPSQADYDQLIEFCQTRGLTVIATHPNRTVLSVDGAVADIEKGFNTTINLYQHPVENRVFYAPAKEPTYDLHLLHIYGLDNLNRPKPNRHATPLVMPLNGSGPSGMFMGRDFRKAYAPGVTATGAGQTLALVEFDGYYSADIKSYLTKAGLSAVPLETVLIDGYNGKPGIGNGEVALDIQVAIAMAPGLDRILVYEADPSASPIDLLNRIATDNRAKQISCSWSWSPPEPLTSQIFQQYAAQGQSFLTASGDEDAYTGAIGAPADDPFVTAVGGTILTMTTAWSSETTWNERVSGFGTGGGFSTVFPIPTWQSAANMNNNAGSAQYRNVPDIAMVAANVLSIADNGTSYNTSGTSISAPLWAAFVALANETATANHQPTVGFLNPTLYAMGNSGDGTLFHDITTGDNTSSTSPTRFYATAGYDLCTGWGSPTGNNTINALLQGPAAVSATVDHFAISLSPSPWTINAPLSVTIAARTTAESAVSTFSGQLTLAARTDSGETLSIEPASVTCNKGAWTGSVRISASAANLTLTATDATGHSGASVPINVAAQLRVIADPKAGGSVVGSGNWVAGANPKLTAFPTEGWKFVSWQDGDIENPRELVMPTTNATFTAMFALLDRTLPVVSFTTKGGTLKTTNPVITITGRAADNSGVAFVQYRINSNDWVTADGTTNWSGTVTLTPGVNTINAVSTDTSTNQSRTATLKINYVPSETVTITIVGNGSVSPNLNGKTVDFGKTITLTAGPAAGYVFDSWNSGVSTKTAKFIATSNLDIVATFIPNPFTPIAGTYNGLWIPNQNFSPTNSGYITLTVTSSGSFSGRLLTSTTIPISGRFNTDGTVQQTIPSQKPPWSLSLVLDTNGLIGQITGPNWVAPVQADRSPWNSRTNPAPFVGVYKLTADTNSFGTLTVNSGGRAQVVGTLPDKTHVSQTTTISVNGDWPLYQRLYSGAGSLIGWGKLTNDIVDNPALWFSRTGLGVIPIQGTR